MPHRSPEPVKIIEILRTCRQKSRFRHFQLESPPELDWGPFGTNFGSLSASRWLQHGFQSSQDGSKATPGASKTPPRRLQDRSRTSQDASRTAPSAPRTPPRLSKSLQDGSVSLQDVSKSSPEEVFEAPSRLQEISGGAFQASNWRRCAVSKRSLAMGLGRRVPRSVYNSLGSP